MLVTTKILLGIGLVLGTAVAATASETEACLVSEASIGELIDWIEANTGYDVSRVRSNPPVIESCVTGELIDYAHEATIVDEGINGLYDFEARRIYLVEPWDHGDLRDRSVLLHELIHAVQFDDREWDCIGAPEWEAYKLQEAWLAERGLDADFDWMRIYFQSRCPRDIHPD
jgi:hypothetical protein